MRLDRRGLCLRRSPGFCPGKSKAGVPGPRSTGVGTRVAPVDQTPAWGPTHRKPSTLTNSEKPHNRTLTMTASSLIITASSSPPLRTQPRPWARLVLNNSHIWTHLILTQPAYLRDWWSSGWDLELPMQGARVRSLVGEVDPTCHI